MGTTSTVDVGTGVLIGAGVTLGSGESLGPSVAEAEACPRKGGVEVAPLLSPTSLVGVAP